MFPDLPHACPVEKIGEKGSLVNGLATIADECGESDRYSQITAYTHVRH